MDALTAIATTASTAATAAIDYSRCFELYREDRSYRKHMAAMEQERAVAALQQQQQQQEEERRSRRSMETDGRQKAALSSSSSTSSSSSPYTLAHELDRRPGTSIEQVLGSFVRREELEEYSCPRCRHKGPGSMRSSLSRLPDVLVLHLQRLTYNGKIRTLVKFPLEGLSMLPYTTGR